MANATPDRGALAAYQRDRHAADVRRVQRSILALRRRGGTVTFMSVAREAGIGRATLYRQQDLRRLVVAARTAKSPSAPWRSP